MKSLVLLFPLFALTLACGDNAYRCKNPDKSVDDMWVMTKSICNELNEDICWCYYWAEYYCDPSGDNINKFKEMCDSHSNWYWTEC